MDVLKSRLQGKKDSPAPNGKEGAGPAKTLLSRIEEPVAQKQRPGLAARLAAALGNAGEEGALLSDDGGDNTILLRGNAQLSMKRAVSKMAAKQKPG